LNIQNSRFITYPDLVDKQNNYVILLVDALVEDIENAGLFCKTSVKDYDIYLYREDMNEPNWLESVANLADTILINHASSIKFDQTNTKLYGISCDLKSPLQFLRDIDG